MINSKIDNKKLKAIVFTDIVDFTKLSSSDEHYALTIIDKQRELLKPIVKRYNGEWLKEIGDGLLLSFDSSLDAVNCSIQMQQALKKIDDFKIRIGIHQGDIFIKDGDVFGDDVNIASRIESYAPKGGIAISDKINMDISGVKDIKTSFIGHRRLKGVLQETKVSCITSNNLPTFKISLLRKINIFLSFFFGFQMLIGFLFALFLFFVGGKDGFGVGNGGGIIMSDEEMLILGLNTSLVFLLLGYSNWSYTRGVSIKSQKVFLLFSYVYIGYYLSGEFLYLISVLYRISISEDYKLFPLIISIAFVIPLIIVLLFKFFSKWRYQKRSWMDCMKKT